MLLTNYTHRFFLFILLSSSCFVKSQNITPIEVTYCVDPHWAPYESIEENRHLGISRLYIQLIEKKSPLKFHLIKTHDWYQTLDYVESGKCQLVPMLNSSSEREEFLSFSNEYFRAPNALYSHYNQPLIGNLSNITIQTVAVVKGYRMHFYLKSTFPYMNIITVKNEQEGLKKVDSQEVDFFIGSFYSVNKIIDNSDFTQLRIVGIAEIEDKLRMGVNKSAENLLPYINTAIANITEQEHAAIFNYLKVLNVVKQKDYSVAINTAIISIIIIVILLLGYWQSIKVAKQLADKNEALEKLHSQLEKKNQQLAEFSIRDPLTMLYNRAHLTEVIDQQIKLKSRYHTSACIIMIDIDDFKIINDTYGHKIGDDILVYLSTILIECARDSDVIFRWGGEEFVYLCPETEFNEAVELAKRFQITLSLANEKPYSEITCSIGVAELNPENTADDWFIIADTAMYQAKKHGKNLIFSTEGQA